MSSHVSGGARRGVHATPARLAVVGVVLAAGAAATALLSEPLDLGLEPVVLLGAALGAVLALVPDSTPARRLGGAAAGFVLAFAGYVLRAALLPDSSAGRAVAVGAVVLLCTAVAVATANRLPLWSLLLGTVGVTGAYELTYAAAPPRLVETSLSTGSSLALTAALGFALALLAAGRTTGADAAAGPVTEASEPRWAETDAPAEDAHLDDLMGGRA